MDDLIRQLAEVLEHEADIYEGILKISREKTDIIVKGRVNELESIVNTEQALILKTAKLEGQREDILSKISDEIGVKPEDINISGLLDHMTDNQAKAVKNSQERLVKAINELKNINNLNSKLVKNSLDYINFSLNLLTGSDGEDNNYNMSGSASAKKARNLFNVKI